MSKPCTVERAWRLVGLALARPRVAAREIAESFMMIIGKMVCSLKWLKVK
jgi:hypothetical protein